MQQLDLFASLQFEPFPPLASDQVFRRAAQQKQYFKQVRAAFNRYGSNLRQVARHVKDLINPFDPTNEDDMRRLGQLITQYSDMLTPWAEATATRFINDVAQRDERAWFKTAKDLGVALRDEVRHTPIGATVYRLIDDQVRMIKDIPLEAGREMQELAFEAATGGKRYDEITPRIKEIHEMTDNRATLIARTEASKAQSAITRARAEFIGSTHYIWHAAMDYATRPMHKELNGHEFSWADPPVAEEGGDRHHPGDFPNCRCWAEPIIPS
jgi:SPP1 gp7 family putative phage head morphogenesis protein